VVAAANSGGGRRGIIDSVGGARFPASTTLPSAYRSCGFIALFCSRALSAATRRDIDDAQVLRYLRSLRDVHAYRRLSKEQVLCTAASRDRGRFTRCLYGHIGVVYLLSAYLRGGAIRRGDIAYAAAIHSERFTQGAVAARRRWERGRLFGAASRRSRWHRHAPSAISGRTPAYCAPADHLAGRRLVYLCVAAYLRRRGTILRLRRETARPSYGVTALGDVCSA